MANNELVITLSLVDEFSANLSQAAKKLDTFSEEAKKLGRTMNEVGRNMAFLGAGVLAPLTVALKSVSNTNGDVNKSFKQIQNSINNVSMSISSSLVPLLQSFTGLIIVVTNAWLSFDEQLRNSIIQFTAISGAIFLIGGSLTFLMGKLLLVSSAFLSVFSIALSWSLINIPLIATIATITVLIGLMIKFKDVGDVIVSTFEIMFTFLLNGFHTVNAAIAKMVEVTLQGLLFIVDGLAKIPGPTQEAFQVMSEKIRESQSIAREFAELELVSIQDKVKDIGSILATGQGDWSLAFESGKESVQGLIDKFGDLQKVGQQTSSVIAVSFKEKFDSAKGALQTLSTALNQSAQENKKFAVAAQVVAIGMAIMNVAEGVTNVWAKWAAVPPVAAALSAVVVAAGALQIATISQQKFALGTPNVPNTMVAEVHKGETIIPATFAESIRRGDLSLSGPGGSSFGDINIFIQGGINSAGLSIEAMAEKLGFEFARNVRVARG